MRWDCESTPTPGPRREGKILVRCVPSASSSVDKHVSQDIARDHLVPYLRMRTMTDVVEEGECKIKKSGSLRNGIISNL